MSDKGRSRSVRLNRKQIKTPPKTRRAKSTPKRHRKNDHEAKSKDNKKQLISNEQKKKLKQMLHRMRTKKRLLRSSSNAYTKTGLIGGRKRKTRKNKQSGGMPLVVHNLFDGIGFLGSSFINTLKGVPIGNMPLPFLGHFA